MEILGLIVGIGLLIGFGYLLALTWSVRAMVDRDRNAFETRLDQAVRVGNDALRRELAMVGETALRAHQMAAALEGAARDPEPVLAPAGRHALPPPPPVPRLAPPLVPVVEAPPLSPPPPPVSKTLPSPGPSSKKG